MKFFISIHSFRFDLNFDKSGKVDDKTATTQVEAGIDYLMVKIKAID